MAGRGNESAGSNISKEMRSYRRTAGSPSQGQRRYSQMVQSLPQVTTLVADGGPTGWRPLFLRPNRLLRLLTNALR